MLKVVQNKNLQEFAQLFRKYLADFVIGAFAFVAALLWRDAIQEFINNYRQLIESLFPFQGVLITKFLIAIAVTVIAVLFIALISKILKKEKK